MFNLFEKEKPKSKISEYARIKPSVRSYTTQAGAEFYTYYKNMFEDGSHILIAGTTGSGKSVFINGFIYSVLAIASPVSAKFIFCDPKRVELVRYKNLPHCIRYASEQDEIINALEYAISLMENRYKTMQLQGIRQSTEAPVYIVIDELADLMTTCKKAVLPLLQRIAQLGRASNIRLLCATQAPNRKVIPAELTLNFNIRIALHCFSPIESRQIINTKGAELLPRYGNAIVNRPEGLVKINVPLVSEDKILDRIRFWELQS